MLHTMTIESALELWGELDDAYYGKNGFGGDTAELYVYRFMGGSNRDVKLLDHPGVLAEMVRDNFTKANKAMHAFFSLYAEKRRVKILVDDKELGPWLETTLNTHRVHVRVVHL